MPNRYNPFASHEPSLEDNSDVQKINEILNNCDYYDIGKIGEILSNNQSNKMTILFSNIDGNATNFDSFCTEIANDHHKFSIITLAETNIDAEINIDAEHVM